MRKALLLAATLGLISAPVFAQGRPGEVDGTLGNGISRSAAVPNVVIAEPETTGTVLVAPAPQPTFITPAPQPTFIAPAPQFMVVAPAQPTPHIINDRVLCNDQSRSC